MKATLAPNRKLRFVEGVTKDGKPYAFVASLVDVETAGGGHELHELTFQPEEWDAIAQAACALSTIVFDGELVRYTDPSKRYVVNEGTKDAYERQMFRGKLADIKDSVGSAIAYKRGARLPSVSQLRARLLADAGIAPADAEAPAEEAAK